MALWFQYNQSRATHAGLFFFFQAEDGIRDVAVTGVQTCALPICHVIGIVAPQLAPQTEVSGVRTEDMNNLVYAPLNAVLYRLEDSQSALKDEIEDRKSVV